MTREKVSLHNALTAAYKELLRQPHDRFRAINQRLYVEVRDAIAQIDGSTSEQVQVHFETAIAQETEQ